MRHRLTPLVPALLFALLAWGCDSAPTSFYEISGEITDERTGDPIGGAAVSFISDTGYGAETTADGDGIYRLAIETDHPFGQVRAEASGYVPKERTVYFDAEDRRIDIALRPSGGSM
jgi:hypothetical protein